MVPNTAALASPESAARKPQRARRRWITLGVLSLVWSAYNVASALWWTSENSWLTSPDQLWFALTAGLLGTLFMTLYVLARKRRVR